MHSLVIAPARNANNSVHSRIQEVTELGTTAETREISKG